MIFARQLLPKAVARIQVTHLLLPSCYACRLVARREDADAVHAALARLRPDDRIALLMSAHGCPIPEISHAVRRTELATRSLLCRARIRLRDIVERQEKNR